jgi:hypothetical protein
MAAIDWSQLNGGQAAQGGGGAIDWSQVNGAQSAPAAAAAAVNGYTPSGGPAPNMLTSLGAGLGHGFGSMMLGAQQLLGQGAKAVGRDGSYLGKAGDWLVNDAKRGMEKLDSEYSPYQNNNPTMAGAGNFVGEVAPMVMTDGLLGSVAPGAKAAEVTAKVLPKATPKLIQSLAPAAAAGAVGGAEASLINPVREEGDFWQQKGDQMKSGALGGLAMAPVGAAAAKMLSPAGPSAEVQKLMDAGITPTPGQMAGGAWNAAEQKLSSMPVVGNLINAARGRTINDFNVAVANRALAPIGQTVPKDIGAGSALQEHVANTIGKVYDDVAPKARFAADPTFGTELATIRTQLAQTAPGKIDQFDNIIKNQITDKLKNGQMSGTQWGDTRSMIGSFVRQNTAGNANVEERALGSALDNLRDAVNSAAFRASPAEVQPAIGSANAAWSQYKQMERAAGTVGAFNRGNVFSPAQYTAAVRKDLSAGQRAQGQGMNTDFAQTAQQVLGNSVPDSGTAGRLGEAGLAGAIFSHPGMLLNPKLYAAAVPAMAYTGPGQKFMAAAMQARPGMAPVASVVRRTAPTMGGLLGSQQYPTQPTDEFGFPLFGE